jgi:hypothetical protein
VAVIRPGNQSAKKSLWIHSCWNVWVWSWKLTSPCSIRCCLHTSIPAVTNFKGQGFTQLLSLVIWILAHKATALTESAHVLLARIMNQKAQGCCFCQLKREWNREWKKGAQYVQRTEIENKQNEFLVSNYLESILTLNTFLNKFPHSSVSILEKSPF